MESADPTVVHTIAVTVSDVVTAVELNRTTDDRAVLRVTPPFSGRMRARLHVERGGYDDDPEPLHVDPESMLADEAPAYPRPADTEDELRSDPEQTYTVTCHHDRHEAAITKWRSELTAAIRDRTYVETPAGPQEVTVVMLDDSDSLHENVG